MAAQVWARFGDVQNFVDPFCGSLAVLLARPHAPRIETVNDIDRFISNFWRAVKADPEGVARHADYPVIETDLESRHYWLVTEGAARLAEIMPDPEGYDAKIAGWWVWGLCSWIGSGWCSGEGPWVVGADGWELRDAGKGVNRQLPHLNGSPGRTNGEKGINSLTGEAITDYMLALRDRLRRVRVCCGDWKRVLTPCVTFTHGITGVFLDPPYSAEAGRNNKLYSHESLDVAHAVREWAIANGDNSLLRIALCGYDGEHDMPSSWECVAWKAVGGYASTAAVDTDGKANRLRERICFSPHCLSDDLFSGKGGA